MNKHLGLKCPHCGQRSLMGGEQREYNPRSIIDGKQICLDCKIEELKRFSK